MGGAAFAGPVQHLYLHVPFCRAKCAYCDFASRAVGGPGELEGREEVLDGYVRGVAAEWERERAAHRVRRLHTLYLGGGTPSLLGPERLERVLAPLRRALTPRAEVTVEANPEDVTEGFASWAAARGVRVSLGVQSFAPGLRRALGRATCADPAAAFARLRAAGCTNLSVDLMHALPGQTPAALEEDIAAVLALRPEHVSWYELTPAVGTPLGDRLLTGSAGSPDPRPCADERAEIYRRIVRALGRAGYDWYEVSNFALPGRRARHNVAYWRARPYLGLGPGAVSTVGDRRWTTASEFAAWERAVLAGQEPPREVEELDASTRAYERLLLAARCGDPVASAELADLLDARSARQLADAGLISLRGGTLTVTRKGRYVAGEVCVRLFRD